MHIGMIHNLGERWLNIVPVLNKIMNFQHFKFSVGMPSSVFPFLFSYIFAIVSLHQMLCYIITKKFVCKKNLTSWKYILKEKH